MHNNVSGGRNTWWILVVPYQLLDSKSLQEHYPFWEGADQISSAEKIMASLSTRKVDGGGDLHGERKGEDSAWQSLLAETLGSNFNHNGSVECDRDLTEDNIGELASLVTAIDTELLGILKTLAEADLLDNKLDELCANCGEKFSRQTGFAFGGGRGTCDKCHFNPSSLGGFGRGGVFGSNAQQLPLGERGVAPAVMLADGVAHLGTGLVKLGAKLSHARSQIYPAKTDGSSSFSSFSGGGRGFGFGAGTSPSAGPSAGSAPGASPLGADGVAPASKINFASKISVASQPGASSTSLGMFGAPRFAPGEGEALMCRDASKEEAVLLGQLMKMQVNSLLTARFDSLIVVCSEGLGSYFHHYSWSDQPTG